MEYSIELERIIVVTMISYDNLYDSQYHNLVIFKIFTRIYDASSD